MAMLFPLYWGIYDTPENLISSMHAITLDNASNVNMSVQDLKTNGLMQGLFTAMQGTMATQLSNVNMLQQKQNGDTPNTVAINQLDKYYTTHNNNSKHLFKMQPHNIGSLRTLCRT